MCRTPCVLVLVAMCVGCTHSWDFAITAGDKLIFFTNETKTHTVIFDSQNLTALVYDEVHNMILYNDKQNNSDAIRGYDISSMENKCFIERNGSNIHGLAFDPATELLFFSDTNERSINWISLKPGSENNVNGNLFIKVDNGIPTDIAVDSCSGYIYWINTNLTTPTIERARFNSSEIEVLLNTTSMTTSTGYKVEPYGLAIDQQTQKMYWIEPASTKHYLYTADFNGKNKRDLVFFKPDTKRTRKHTSNILIVTKKSALLVDWNFDSSVWTLRKSLTSEIPKKVFQLHRENTLGIAANYKIKDQIQKIQGCAALTSLILNNSDGSICVHGIKVNAQPQSSCKCTSGYIGERCDTSVCENYCLQGNCSFNADGLPTCRCEAGYSGDRCEVYACHGYCGNNGNCSLNEISEPVCECREDYVGDRCEVSDCLNYCIHGNCSFNDEGLPICRCNAGYFGERCEVDPCQGFCLNNGDCSLNEEDEPDCRCDDSYEGSRCEAVKNVKVTFTNTPAYYSAERNLTITELLSNWQKPTAKISITVEVKSN